MLKKGVEALKKMDKRLGTEARAKSVEDKLAKHVFQIPREPKIAGDKFAESLQSQYIIPNRPKK